MLKLHVGVENTNGHVHPSLLAVSVLNTWLEHFRSGWLSVTTHAIQVPKRFAVVEVPNVREGAVLHSRSWRGRPYGMSSWCRPVAVALPP